jgi:hypothetical protein
MRNSTVNLSSGAGSPIAADGLHRAILERGQACSLLCGIGRLLIYVTMAPHFVAAEIQGCDLSAKVAVDTGGVDVESAGYVLRYFVRRFGHICDRFLGMH